MSILRRKNQGPPPEVMLDSTELAAIEARENAGAIIGNLATHQSGEAFLAKVETLGPELDKYDQAWTAVNTETENKLNDPEIDSMLEVALEELRTKFGAAANGRERKRQSRKVTQDVPEFLGAHLLYARMKGITERSYQLTHQGGVKARNVIGSSVAIAQGYRAAVTRVESKWLGIKVAADDETPTLGRFFDTVEEFGKAQGHNFKVASKARANVIEGLTEYGMSSPAKSLELLETLPELADSPDQRHMALLQIVAADFAEYRNESMVGQLLDRLAKGGEIGRLAAAFLVERAQEDDGDNALTFMQKMYDKTRTPQDPNFLTYMADNQAEWWPGLSEDYRTFASDRKAKLARDTKRLLESYLVPQQVAPTLYEVESTFDRLFEKVVHAPPQDRAKAGSEDRERKQGIMRNHAGISRMMHTPENARQAEPLEIKMVRPNGNGTSKLENGTSAEDYIQKIIEGSHDKRFGDDLRKIITLLTEQPVGPGRIPIPELSKVMIDGKELTQRRINPGHVKGLQLGERAREARVIYVYHSGSLGILKIFTNHRDYENYLKTN